MLQARKTKTPFLSIFLSIYLFILQQTKEEILMTIIVLSSTSDHMVVSGINNTFIYYLFWITFSFHKHLN